MTYIPMKQPDGQWCVFGTITERFMLEDAAREDVQEFLLEEKRERIER